MKAIAQKRQGIRVSARKEVLEQNRLRNGFERKLRKQLSTAFTRIGRAAQREFVAHGRLLKSIRGIDDTLYKLLEGHYRAVINEFGLRIIRNQKADTQFEFLVREYLRVNGGTRITQISETTRRQIMSVISQADEDGLGVQVTGKRIFDSMNGSFSRYRAATIARTETHSAASFANDQVNRSLNIPNQLKRWVSVADQRTRATHVQANGTEIPLDEDFIIGGVAMKYTGDPKGGAKNVINCRCVTLYITPEDEVVDDLGPQPSVKPTVEGLYGGVTDNELEFHDQAGWNRSSKVFQVIALTRPVEIIRERERGFFRANQRGEMPEINMPTPIGDIRKGKSIGLRERTTWRHEYGHHIDFMMGRFLLDSPTRIGISSQLKDTVLKDRKKHRAPKIKEIDAAAEANILAFLKSRGVEVDVERLAARPSFIGYRAQLDRPSTTDGQLNSFIDDLEFDEKFVNEFLDGSGFNFDDIVTLFGDGLNGKGQIRGGGPIGLLKNVNNNPERKKDFLFFLNDLKVNRVGQGYDNAGWSAWLSRHSHLNEAGYLADYMEAMSNAAIGNGHGKAYYGKFVSLGNGVRMSHTTEMMANYVALMGTDAKRAAVYRKLIERVAPASLAKMDELFDEMIEGGRMPDDI